mgnify:CR=1 FL=1
MHFFLFQLQEYAKTDGLEYICPRCSASNGQSIAGRKKLKPPVNGYSRQQNPTWSSLKFHVNTPRFNHQENFLRSRWFSHAFTSVQCTRKTTLVEPCCARSTWCQSFLEIDYNLQKCFLFIEVITNSLFSVHCAQMCLWKSWCNSKLD